MHTSILTGCFLIFLCFSNVVTAYYTTKMYYYYCLLLLGLAYWVVKRSILSLEQRKFARKKGCQPCRRIPQRERLIGYDLYQQEVTLAREGQSLQAAQNRFRLFGDTFSGVVMGQFFITTVDPENVKALLSSQFSDFDSGKKSLFGPFIGDSMLTTDGTLWKHSRVRSSPPQFYHEDFSILIHFL